MADVAIIFHWSPDVMDPMTLPELMGWREQAAKRAKPPETGKKKNGRP
ncbi:MAG: GpE family phage tail protein [Pseudomonadota bacterium]|uniref:GpE family phage tail protein n=1 Tax=Sphingobium yanoikuyae TaxID=13690 RepID=A0A430BCE8_SPHYA|nr:MULTISPECIES: GpE family phage tail protein [Sphingobium]PZU67503.1 MAG: GpE family phage tail protein [Sphingobium sp.]RSU46236.1 GpE family phage tail protein [Sphingobium yanoikuyae]WBQ15963.1 GpE family phage tail protein [Sphingobium yanoikuyae]